jgi:general secretion pathway protein C
MLELMLAAALGVSLAYWTWMVFTPREIASSPLTERIDGQRAGLAFKRNLFGIAQEGKAAAVPDASPTSSIRLLGILARGTQGSGRAIFAVESGAPKTVEAGSQIVPGLVLKEVHSDHVLVARSGVLERMRLGRRAVSGL